MSRVSQLKGVRNSSLMASQLNHFQVKMYTECIINKRRDAKKPWVCVMLWDAGKLEFACGAGSSLLALPHIPPRVVFAPLLTAWLSYSSVCQKLCLLSGCQNVLGEQSLRKELVYIDLILFSVSCGTLWVVEMSFIRALLENNRLHLHFQDFLTRRSLRPLWQNKMFSSISNCFLASHCGAKSVVGREVIFQACPALLMGRSLGCVATERGKMGKK